MDSSKSESIAKSWQRQVSAGGGVAVETVDVRQTLGAERVRFSINSGVGGDDRAAFVDHSL